MGTGASCYGADAVEDLEESLDSSTKFSISKLRSKMVPGRYKVLRRLGLDESSDQIDKPRKDHIDIGFAIVKNITTHHNRVRGLLENGMWVDLAIFGKEGCRINAYRVDTIDANLDSTTNDVVPPQKESVFDLNTSYRRFSIDSDILNESDVGGDDVVEMMDIEARSDSPKSQETIPITVTMEGTIGHLWFGFSTDKLQRNFDLYGYILIICYFIAWANAITMLIYPNTIFVTLNIIFSIGFIMIYSLNFHVKYLHKLVFTFDFLLKVASDIVCGVSSFFIIDASIYHRVSVGIMISLWSTFWTLQESTLAPKAVFYILTICGIAGMIFLMLMPVFEIGLFRKYSKTMDLDVVEYEFVFHALYVQAMFTITLLLMKQSYLALSSNHGSSSLTTPVCISRQPVQWRLFASCNNDIVVN